MNSSQSAPVQKKSNRGKIVIGAFSGVVGLVVTIVIFTPPPPKKECEFRSSSGSGTGNTQSAVIFAPTSNFVDFSSVVERASSEVNNALGANLPDSEKAKALGRELSLIVADSSPSLIVNSSVKSEGDASQDISRGIKSTFADIDIAARCAAGDLKQPEDQIPTDEETDMLKAMSVASDQFNTLKEKSLFILGNGIQTSGAILMQEEGAFPKDSSSAKLLARSLQNKGEIPDLTDVRVTWYGLGQVDGEYQEPLPLAKIKALEVFWREVVRLGGGSVGDICQQCGTGIPSTQSIKVSKVDSSACPVMVTLYESDGVEFKPDSDEFVSVGAAKSAAKATVAKFVAKKCSFITVSGFAAAGEDKGVYDRRKAEIDGVNKVLTKRRAASFAKLIKTAGFTGDIKFVGMGTCGTEWNAEGNAVEKLQRLCRRVEVSN
jgi:hypothetical protein